jgi:hypothetical protein
MKGVHAFGAVAAVVVLLAMCGPASATEIMYSFTAQQLIDAIDSDPSFGLGGTACGAVEASFSTYCGIYDVTATLNLPSASVVSMATPSSAGSATWETAISGGGADFYADMEDESDQYISFVTTNTNTVGQYYYTLESIDPYEIGLNPLASSTVFSFVVTTSASVAAAQAATFSLTIEALPLNANGSDNTTVNSDGKWFEDDTITNFSMESVAVPEPASGLLCLIGLAAWAMHRKRRPVHAEAPYPPDTAGAV